MNWLGWSIVASVVLTVLLNVGIRLWPGAADRGAERVTDWTDRHSSDADGRNSGVRVIFPWKAMLIGSIALTILLNVVLRVF